jgi:hypothetical protein
VTEKDQKLIQPETFADENELFGLGFHGWYVSSAEGFRAPAPEGGVEALYSLAERLGARRDGR